MTAIGPNFPNELKVAGLFGLPFSWGADGSMHYDAAITSAQQAAIEAVLAAHNPATPDPNAEYAAALAAGLAIVSTGTAALDGTYACDVATQAKITAEAVYIQATGGPASGKFTNGQTTRPWPDLTGAPHNFSTTAFIDFAEAIGQYVDGLLVAQASALAAAPWTWSPPAQPVTIA